jgi:hypothetical protein
MFTQYHSVLLGSSNGEKVTMLVSIGLMMAPYSTHRAMLGEERRRRALAACE